MIDSGLKNIRIYPKILEFISKLKIKKIEFMPKKIINVYF